MVYKKIVDNELYLYRNGKLIYKRWLNHKYSLVFDIIPYTKYTLKTIKDAKEKYKNQKIHSNLQR